MLYSCIHMAAVGAKGLKLESIRPIRTAVTLYHWDRRRLAGISMAEQVDHQSQMRCHELLSCEPASSRVDCQWTRQDVDPME